MFTLRITLLAVGFGVFCAVPPVQADVPQSMSVQGQLLDASGTPVASGAATLTFRIYDADALGNEVWPGGGETQVINIGADGRWSADLGAVTPLTEVVFSTDTARWLEITVEIGAAPPETLSRIRLQTNPYAFQAASAQLALNATQLGGQLPGDFAAAGHTHPPADIDPQGAGSGLDADLLDGLQAVDFAVQNHGHTPAEISPQGDGSGLDADLLDGKHGAEFADTGHVHGGQWLSNGANIYYNAGRVGIGTGSPEQLLHVLKGGTTGVVPASGSIGVFESNSNGYLSIITPDGTERGLFFGENGSPIAGGIIYNNTITPDGLQFRTAFNVTGMALESSGRLAIGSFTGSGMLQVTGNATNSTVLLPANTISAEEIISEPGLVANTNAALITLVSTTMQTITSVTIDIPTSGHIVIEGKCNGQAYGTTGRNQGLVQIDEIAGGALVSPYVATFGLLGYVNTTPANSFPVYVTRTYFKDAGSHTFLLEASQQAANGPGAVTKIGQSMLTAVFYPTSYGDVNMVVANSEAAAFEQATPLEGVPGSEGYSTVNLRELELRAARLRAEAEKAEQALLEARKSITDE